jgi:release factor glutamine methyltransferase
MTIEETYQESIRRLQSAQSLPRDEAASIARQLIDRVTGVPFAHLSQPRQVLDAQDLERFEGDLSEAIAGRPLAYILGSREFYGLTFKTDERALVPRPETETLVEVALKELRGLSQPHVADLGTGSGCIALAIASELPSATVVATDVSSEALELALENTIQLGLQQRVRLLQGRPGEWAAPLLEAENSALLDAVLANPPYIPAGAAAALQIQIRDWEPDVALFAGADGLECYHQVAAQCRVLLKPDGFLAVELGDGLYESARAIFVTHGWRVEEPIPDLAGIERVMVAR